MSDYETRHEIVEAIDKLKDRLSHTTWRFCEEMRDRMPTLRDQFAMAALQGLIACGPHDCKITELASEAYTYADAMLIKREVK